MTTMWLRLWPRLLYSSSNESSQKRVYHLVWMYETGIAGALETPQVTYIPEEGH